MSIQYPTHEYFILCGIPWGETKYEYISGSKESPRLYRLMRRKQLQEKFNTMIVRGCDTPQKFIDVVLRELNGDNDEVHQA